MRWMLTDVESWNWRWGEVVNMFWLLLACLAASLYVEQCRSKSISGCELYSLGAPNHILASGTKRLEPALDLDMRDAP